MILLSTQARAAEPLDFDRTVAPILARRCLDCHSGADPKGGLDLSHHKAALRGGEGGEAIVPGKPDESLLWENVVDGLMPPKANLPESEKAILRSWIEGGAKWGTDPIDPYQVTTNRRGGRDWWSFQPLTRTVAAKSANPIDAFVLQRLSKAGLKPSPRADRRVLIRRLSFDLLGLPPIPEEIEAFVHDDRPDAYATLVDRYLASPQYGVRWARPWLDLARYGESNGFEHDEFRPNAWPYRDWVVNALNRDMPYDEFARLQLAGDVLHPDDPGAIEATGFLVAGAYDSVGQSQLSEVMRKVVRQDELEDMVSTVGQTFLGLTIHCARCHDHKFDPIRQVEYYQLTAALAGVRHGERDLSSLDPKLREANHRINDMVQRVAAIEAPVRAEIRGMTKTKVEPPAPYVKWDFDDGLPGGSESLNLTLQPGAKQLPEGLKVDGKTGFASTVPLTKDLTAKTLEAWVKLDTITQRGGAVISVQTPDGLAFDAITIAERDPGLWMAGSEGFRRTQRFAGPIETEAKQRVVHVAMTYADDGMITAYRDGKPYGKPYKSPSVMIFKAGQAQVVFGMRHAPAGDNRMLAGLIVRARIYDRALSASEVAASAESSGKIIPTAEIEARLTPKLRAERVKLLSEIEAQKASILGRDRKAYVNTPRPAEPVHLLTRGNSSQPAQRVSAGGLAVLTHPKADFGLGMDAPEGERRVRLAQWISDRENPLFSRVIVNRLWQWHFGSGLIEQPSDFGFNGGQPSHPELLDRLASELVSHGWSLKQAHKQIVTSDTYCQSSRSDLAQTRIDSDNRLLWRKSPRRLEAEMVRDAMLAVSGDLDSRLDGPGFREFAVSSAKGTITNRYTPVDAIGPEFTRRTLYRTWARGGRSGFLDAFDCPDPSTTSPRRAVTTTPQQALALLNNALTFQLADHFADRLRREAGDDPAKQVDRAYRLAFGRDPEPDEREQARKVVVNHGAAVFARAIFNSNEFLYID